MSAAAGISLETLAIVRAVRESAPWSCAAYCSASARRSSLLLFSRDSTAAWRASARPRTAVEFFSGSFSVGGPPAALFSDSDWPCFPTSLRPTGPVLSTKNGAASGPLFAAGGEASHHGPPPPPPPPPPLKPPP